MINAIGFLALLAAAYIIVNYRSSQSRELDQLIALEDQAEQLRKRCTYDSSMRERTTLQRNRLLVKIARKRKELAAEHKFRANDINRMVTARRNPG